MASICVWPPSFLARTDADVIMALCPLCSFGPHSVLMAYLVTVSALHLAHIRVSSTEAATDGAADTYADTDTFTHAWQRTCFFSDVFQCFPPFSYQLASESVKKAKRTNLELLTHAAAFVSVSETERRTMYCVYWRLQHVVPVHISPGSCRHTEKNTTRLGHGFCLLLFLLWHVTYTLYKFHDIGNIYGANNVRIFAWYTTFVIYIPCSLKTLLDTRMITFDKINIIL